MKRVSSLSQKVLQNGRHVLIENSSSVNNWIRESMGWIVKDERMMGWKFFMRKDRFGKNMTDKVYMACSSHNVSLRLNKLFPWNSQIHQNKGPKEPKVLGRWFNPNYMNGIIPGLQFQKVLEQETGSICLGLEGMGSLPKEVFNVHPWDVDAWWKSELAKGSDTENSSSENEVDSDDAESIPSLDSDSDESDPEVLATKKVC